MKKNIIYIISLVFLIMLSGCGNNNDTNNENSSDNNNEVSSESMDEESIDGKDKLVIGTNNFLYEYVLVLEEVYERETGKEMEVLAFDDGILPNTALAEGQIDATIHQHIPYMEAYNESNNTTNSMHDGKAFMNTLRIMISKEIESPQDLKEGDSVAIQDDSANRSLALWQLEEEGLIEIDEQYSLGDVITQTDITSNPLNLEIVEMLAGPQLISAQDDVTMVITNASAYIQSGGSIDDAISECSEEMQEIIALGLAVREEDIEADWGYELKEIMAMEEVENFLLEKYEGALNYSQEFKDDYQNN